MSGDASGREAEGMTAPHPTEHRRGGLWAGWQITGHSCCYRDCCCWRRWITHQHSSVSHQSPLTSHHRHRCPTPQTHLLTHISSGCGTKSHSGWAPLTDQLKLRENATPSYILLLSISRTLSSFLFSLSPTYHLNCHFGGSLLLCRMLLPRLFSHFPTSLLLPSDRGYLHPVVPCAIMVCISLPCLTGHHAAQHNRGGKSLLTF